MTTVTQGDLLGSLPDNEIADYLTSIGDVQGASAFMQGQAAGQHILDRSKKSFVPAGSVIGFIPAGSAGPRCAILGIGQLRADRSLIGQRIKISLDKFYVDEYPGFGRHNILCEFSGRNQVAGEAEPLKFALRFQADDHDGASIMGVPIFLGLTVGADGIAFEGATVNVSSNKDEALLGALQSPSFQSGLNLLTVSQPALKPFTNLAEAVVKNVLARSANKAVHKFSLGLDFSANVTSARLLLGSYIVVQTNRGDRWSWDELEWNTDAQLLRYRDHERMVDFNYMVFGVSPFEGAV